MRTHRCVRREDYFDLVNSAEFTERWMLESHLAAGLAGKKTFTLPGICSVCMQAVDLRGSFDGAWVSPDGLAVPNWRECLFCPRCELNGRQRSTARLIVDVALSADRGTEFCIYMMEQISPLHAWVRSTFAWANLIGSEYLGDGIAPGTIRNGLRHEDAEMLSLADRSCSLVVSCDVFEHVNDPEQAFREMVRVLRPGGRVILTFPMDPHLDRNRRRAWLRHGTVEHVEPPIYHGNPLSAQGSLVVTDFGWQVLEQLRDAGLPDAALNVYWSYVHGYLGIQFYFDGSRPVA